MVVRELCEQYIGSRNLNMTGCIHLWEQEGYCIRQSLVYSPGRSGLAIEQQPELGFGNREPKWQNYAKLCKIVGCMEHLVSKLYF